jgi:ADP-ribose pyrophosphatase
MSGIKSEPTVRSETVFAGNLLDVRKETVRLPRGETVDREIVVHPEVVAVLPVLDDGRLVLVRQYRKAVDRILLEVPAGGIEPGERPEEAVRREMVEETGYRVGACTALTSFYTSPGFTTEFMHLFKATGLAPGRATEEADQIEVQLYPLDRALEAVETGEISDAKSILALLLHARNEGRPQSG